MSKGVRVLVPATTANLGPGFDCLGMALDLYNTFQFELGLKGFSAAGEGEEALRKEGGRLIYRAWEAAYGFRGLAAPPVRSAWRAGFLSAGVGEQRDGRRSRAGCR